MSRKPEVLSLCATIAIVVAIGPKLSRGAVPAGVPAAAAQPMPSPAALGITFVPNSSTRVIVERDGERYLVDIASHTITNAQEPIVAGANLKLAGSSGAGAAAGQPDGAAIFKQNCSSCHGPGGKGVRDIHTPDFTNPQTQAKITDEQMTDIITHGKTGTMMPAWGSKITDEDILAVRGFLRSLASSNQSVQLAESKPKVYTPGDDLLFSLPTGRRVARHAMIINFTHRFPYTPAFTGQAEGGSLLGLDDFALPSFGFRYGVTDKVSVSISRSPTFLGRPIEMMAAYNFLDEHSGQPINAVVRASMQGLNNFSREYTENLEGIFSRSLGSRAQLYFVPTLSINARRLAQAGGFLTSEIPNVPGYNTVSLGAGGAFDIRPTVALVAEMIPTVVNGRPLDIHRPAYSFGIQKKIWRHAFTFGFTTSPGTTISQRAGTRAAFLGDPTADKPGGLFAGFDLSRQIY